MKAESLSVIFLSCVCVCFSRTGVDILFHIHLLLWHTQRLLAQLCMAAAATRSCWRWHRRCPSGVSALPPFPVPSPHACRCQLCAMIVVALSFSCGTGWLHSFHAHCASLLVSLRFATCTVSDVFLFVQFSHAKEDMYRHIMQFVAYICIYGYVC